MSQLPNILILLLDTARAQNFSLYGYERPTSPHLAALAREGVTYEQAIAPGCWSLPSQVSLLTGMYPHKHGAHERHLSYAHPYPLLPEVLRQVGYRTVGISTNTWMTDEFGVTHGFDHYLKLWQLWHTMPDNGPAGPWHTLRRRLNRLYWRRVFPQRNRARHLHRHLRQVLANTPEPFFCYAIYWDMHLPYAPTGHHAMRWLPPGMTPAQVQGVNRNPLLFHTGQVAMEAEDFAILQALYDGALASIDEEIGALIDFMRQCGLLDRTVLIVTSDHGENIGDHGLMSHAYSLHDTLIRVPLIIRYPDVFAGGLRISQQVQLTDIFPTLLDVLQLDFPDVRQELQGLSLVAADLPEPRLAYAEMLAPHPSIVALNRRSGAPEETPRPALDRALRCLRTPDMKIIWASNGAHALYDLRRDPHETTNRLAAEPQLAATLLKTLEAWHPPAGAPLASPTPAMEQDVQQRLRDLGYLA